MRFRFFRTQQLFYVLADHVGLQIHRVAPAPLAQIGLGHRLGDGGHGKALTVHAGPEILRYVVEKGSITIDGISLTVAAVDGEGFSVSTIPHTVAQTNLSQRRRGDPVNLETDVVGKYIEKLLRPEETKPHTPANESTLTKEMLLRCGF